MSGLMPVDTSNEVAISTYLERARDWLSRAVDETGPEQIAAAKAEIATAAEATKQLGLSKEIRLDAQEMVRRAEYALGKAIRRGQEDGVIATHGGGRRSTTGTPTLTSPSEFATKQELSGAGHGQPGIYALADSVPDAEDFDVALDAAREEGNLSRANVARHAQAASQQEPYTPRRKSLPDAFKDRLYDVGTKAESLHRLISDDRWTQNAKKLATAKNRNELLRINDLLNQVIDSLPETEATP